jgi:hypothetical protein
MVVKVFDPSRVWLPARAAGDPVAEHGRGLSIVHALTSGRWGHHLTRSRLSRPTIARLPPVRDGRTAAGPPSAQVHGALPVLTRGAFVFLGC